MRKKKNSSFWNYISWNTVLQSQHFRSNKEYKIFFKIYQSDWKRIEKFSRFSESFFEVIISGLADSTC